MSVKYKHTKQSNNNLVQSVKGISDAKSKKVNWKRYW